jgi:hypothetical protein
LNQKKPIRIETLGIEKKKQNYNDLWAKHFKKIPKISLTLRVHFHYEHPHLKPLE